MAFGGTPNETAPARLLIVEDDVLLATALEELLCTSGFEVVGIAGSAATAASLAGERHPQLALIDIRLVGPIDGIELACHLREQFRIPAIFLSGLTDPETKERALVAKPLGFLRKPYRASQVFNVIQRALSSHDTESEKSTVPRKNRAGATPHSCGN
jgi:DNA-binding response OmpR family regulator